LREKAQDAFRIPITSAVAGRPVRFVGAETEEDNLYAESRLRSAYQLAGFETVQFEMEPVAAAYYYESTLQQDELIMIGDFGGGTSDFSLIRVGPSIRRRGRSAEDLLGNAGIGIAGDTFDAKIVRHLVSPFLGAGTEMRSINKLLPVPTWVYSKLERWHHLSFLKARDTMNMLASVKAQALEPQKIEALIHLVSEDLGYRLHQAVQKTKSALFVERTARFCLHDGAIEIDAVALRSSFESWIADDLAAMEACVDSLLRDSGVKTENVHKVFLTGGSSFVPAVRRIFERRFARTGFVQEASSLRLPRDWHSKQVRVLAGHKLSCETRSIDFAGHRACHSLIPCLKAPRKSSCFVVALLLYTATADTLQAPGAEGSSAGTQAERRLRGQDQPGWGSEKH
jgi:hypothetical chaperone protein